MLDDLVVAVSIASVKVNIPAISKFFFAVRYPCFLANRFFQTMVNKKIIYILFKI